MSLKTKCLIVLVWATSVLGIVDAFWIFYAFMSDDLWSTQCGLSCIWAWSLLGSFNSSIWFVICVSRGLKKRWGFCLPYHFLKSHQLNSCSCLYVILPTFWSSALVFLFDICISSIYSFKFMLLGLPFEHFCIRQASSKPIVTLVQMNSCMNNKSFRACNNRVKWYCELF